MTFDLPKENPSIIKVIGVGGGGCNAVNHMYRQGIKGVDFLICNTDQQALDASPIPVKFQLGSTLTEGRGAGSLPEVGKNAAIESIEEIREQLSTNTKMLFVTAGMGGGTGTGAAPVIAATAKEMGILTVGIVTIPFSFEGKRRRQQAEDGIEQMRKNVDTLLVISNDKLREMCGNLKLNEAFANADNVLTTAAKGIAEIITVTGYINVDFADVETVMKNGGAAIMGSALAEGKDRAITAVKEALSSPLLNDNRIDGAKHILINITAGDGEVMLDEITEIVEFAQEETGHSANVIFGTGHDESLGNKISVTLIATGFEVNNIPKEKIVHSMAETKKEATAPVQPTQETVVTKNEQAEAPVISQVTKVVERNSEGVEFEFTVKAASQPNSEEEINKNEQNEALYQKSKERLKQMNNMLNVRLVTPSPVSEMETKPAYQRREVKLDNTVHSQDEYLSKYSTDVNDEKKTEIRLNNGPNQFLYTKVD